MPTNRKFRRRAHGAGDLNGAQKHYLLHGVDLRQFDSEIDAFAAWRMHRTVLLLEFIGEHPGRRPFAWWQWEKPAGLLRRQIYGPKPLVDSPVHVGAPCHWPSKNLIFESQVEFLQRNHLLTRGETRDFPTLKQSARAAQKQYFQRRGFTPATLDHIFADWDTISAERK
jgi:hypothetical protein